MGRFSSSKSIPLVHEILACFWVFVSRCFAKFIFIVCCKKISQMNSLLEIAADARKMLIICQTLLIEASSNILTPFRQGILDR